MWMTIGYLSYKAIKYKGLHFLWNSFYELNFSFDGEIALSHYEPIQQRCCILKLWEKNKINEQ